MALKLASPAQGIGQLEALCSNEWAPFASRASARAKACSAVETADASTPTVHTVGGNHTRGRRARDTEPSACRRRVPEKKRMGRERGFFKTP
jgi:hypothetical protein